MSRHEKFSSIGNVLNDALAEHRLYKTKRRLKMIAIHCSASPQGRGDDAHTIDRWHDERWSKGKIQSGLGYHYVVLEDGTIQKGRWIDYAGSHIRGRNSDTLGICRIGNINDTTPNQMKSLLKLTRELQKMYNIETMKVKGHGEFRGVNKDCPGMDMDIFREALDT